MFWRRLNLPGLAALIAVGGCLSGGPPPDGRQLVAARGFLEASFYPQEFLSQAPAGSALLLVWSPGASNPVNGTYTFALSVVTDPGPAGGAPTRRVLLDVQNASFDCPPGIAGCLRLYDSRGRRLFFVSAEAGLRSSLVRVDPRTGDREALAAFAGGFYLSPSGERLAYQAADSGLLFETRLREVDERELVLGVDLRYVTFVGEDLYFVDHQENLQRVSPGGSPRMVAAGVSTFQAMQTADGPRFILTRNSEAQSGRPDPTGVDAVRLFDPATGDSIPLDPALIRNGGLFPSPDGRWIFVARLFDGGREPGETAWFAFVETATGATEKFQLPITYVEQAPWRPGSDEVWLHDQYQIWIARPGQETVRLVRALRAYDQPSRGFVSSPFTSDGAYFFSDIMKAEGDDREIYAVPVDAPTSPGVLLNPHGTESFSYESTPDGRLMIEAFYTDSRRSDLFLVDPVTGTSRLLGQAGRLVALGATRMLALQHCLSTDRCELTLVDLASGATSKLADDVDRVVVDESVVPGDLLAPGTRIAFTVQTAHGSPYDGLWMVALP